MLKPDDANLLNLVKEMTASKSKLQPQLFSADEEIARLEQALVAAKHKRQKLGKLSVVLNTQLKQHKLAMVPEHERIMALLNGPWTSGEIIFNIFEDLCSPHLIEYLDQGTTIFISRLGVIKQSSDLNPISFTNSLRKLVEAMMMKMSTPLPTADSHHKLYSRYLGRNVSRIATCCLELYPVEMNGHTAEIEEDISTVERRWDGDIAFTQQEFVDFYGGLDEWSVATVVLPGELEHHEESEEVISQDVTSLNLERTMGKLPLDWTMSANCKINGEPLSEQIYKNLAAALQDVSSKCGGINEYDNGTFQLMKFGQAIISATGMTAYVSPTA